MVSQRGVAQLAASSAAKAQAELEAIKADPFRRADELGGGNKDGKLSMMEAKRLMMEAFPTLRMHISQAFVDTDEDGSFYLDRAELAALTHSLESLFRSTSLAMARCR